MRVDPISTEVDGKICDLLISMVGKPKNFKFCKASNTYDNRYRIDMYIKVYKGDLEGQAIGWSCSAKLEGKDKLNITSQSTPVSGMLI
jgi:uncharacterized protein YycO